MVAAALLAVGAPKPAKAANIFWDANDTSPGTGGAGTWLNSGSPAWVNAGSGTTVSGTAPAIDYAFTANDIGYFTGTGAEITLGENITVGGLVFTGVDFATRNDYALTGARLTLAAPAGINAPTLRVDLGARVTISSQLAGTAGLIKTGNGTLVLTNNTNTLDGGIFVKAGALVVTSAAQLGGGIRPIAVTGVAGTGSPGFSGGSLVVQAADAVNGLTFGRAISASGRGPGAVNGSGALISVGSNTFTGTVGLGSGIQESRFTAVSGVTTLAGDVHLGAGNSTVFWGNGNIVVSGEINNHDYSQDRIVKTGLIYGTTLWLQNDQNSFTSGVRIDNGTVRVASAGALGLNTGRLAVDLNNGRLEVRSDLLNSFAQKDVFVRDNTNSYLFVDHALDSAAVGGNFQFGDLNANRNNTWFYLNSRNGFGATFTGLNNLIGGGGANNVGINNDGNGLLTLNANLWGQGDGTNRVLYIRGNGDTLVTGSITQTAATASHSFQKEGTGYLTLQGVAGNLKGTFNVIQGTTEIAGLGALGAVTDIRLGGNDGSNDRPATLVYAGPAATLSTPLNLYGARANSIPMLVANGTGPLTVSGTIVSGAASKTFRLGGTNTGDNVITSVIPNNSGTNLTSLQKMGVGTWVLAPNASNTMTGTTTVSNGVLKLREVSANVDILPDAGAVIFNVDPFSYAAGGVLRYEGASAAASTETLGALTPTAGQASIQSVAVGGGSAALTFASLAARGAGATLDVSLTGGTVAFTAAPTGTNGIVGGWATFGGVDWLAVGSPAAALSSYTPLAASGLSATANYLSAADLTVAGPESVNSLKLAGTQTLTLGGLLTIGSGGVLFNNSTGAATITGGTLGASASEVIVTTGGSTPANALTINSLISGGAGSLTKAGNGLVVLTGASTYTGATNINQGTVQLSGTTVSLGANSNVTLRQGTTLDLNAAGASVSNWNTAVAAPRILIGALAGTGTVVNTNAAPAILSLGAGNGNGTLNGLINQTAGVITLVKSGTGTQSLTGLNNYTGATVIRGGTLAVTSLANIGQPSSIGRGDVATNAGSLIFENGILYYTGSQTTSYDNGSRTVNIFSATQTPSVSIDRLFTLAGNAEIQSNGSYGSPVMGRTENHAALVFSNTGDIAYLGTGARTLTLGGNSNGDNQINLRLVDNPNGGALSVNRTGYGAYWTLGNQNNTYTGPTSISGGALIAIDGASLPTASNLRFSQDWSGNSFFQSVGTFDRQLGAGADQWQAGPLTGFAGFAADRTKFIVDWTGQGLIWGNADGTANFLKGSSFALNSGNSLAEIEVRGNFEIRPNAAVPTGLVATTASGSGSITLTTGNVSSLSVGQLITGAGIPANTYITGFNTGTIVNLSQNATAAATGVAVAVSGAGWRDIIVNDNGFTGLDYATISGVISGTGNIGKQGGGTLILGDANTYSGNTILRNEQLVVSSIGADGATASSLGTNVSGGWLELGNPGGGNTVTLTYAGPGEITTRAIYLAGSTGTRRIEASGSGPLTITNLVNSSSGTTLTALSSTSNRTLELRGVNTDLNTVSSVLADSSATQALRVYKADPGVWVLSGANTFTGGLRSDGGSLGFTSAAAMGVLSNVGGTTVTSSNSTTVVMATGSTAGLAVGTYVSGFNFGFGDVVTGVTNGTTFTINNARSMGTGRDIVFGGVLLSNGSVFSTDPAGLTISQPILINNNATGAFSGSAPITVNANVYKFSGGNDSTLSNSLENGAVLTINGNYVNWQTDTNTRMLQIRGQGAKTVWNGVIANSPVGPSRIGISIPNSSIFQLTGSAANTHTGGVLLYQGDLRLSKAGALGTGTFQLEGGTVRGDGIVLTGANKITNQVLLNGEASKFVGSDSVEISGNLVNWNGNRYFYNDISGAGTLTFQGGVNLSHDGTNRILVYQGSGVTNFASALVNGSTSTASSLYARGTGTLNFTAANTFGGQLRMDRGLAVVSGAGTFLSVGNTNPNGIFVRNKAEFTLDNTAGNVVGGRIAGRAVALENNGLFRLIGNAAGTTENAGPLQIREGAGRILMSGAGANVLSFTSVAYANNASVLDLYGISGLGVGNQVRFTDAPVHANFVGGVEGRIGIAGDDFAAYSGVVQLTSGATTNASANVTVASTAGLVVGMRVNGANIPAGTTVASITNGTTFVLSANATATASAQNFTVTPAAGASVVAFAGYSGATTLADAALVPTATAKVTSAYTADDLTAMRSTLNALAVSDATARDISGPQFSTLSLTSGSLLFGRAAGSTAVTHTLSVPRLEFGSTVAPINGYLQVMDGVTVDLTGQVVAGTNFTKMGAGTLLLSNRQYFSSSTNLSGGTVRLGLSNAIYGAGQQYFVHALGSTFDLNGFSQFVGYLATGGQIDGGGLITSSTGAGNFVTNLPGADSRFNGTTSGANVNFGRVGGYTFTMTGAMGHGGVTAFLGGNNTLQDDGSLLNTSELILNYAQFTVDSNGDTKRVNNNRVSDSAPVSMRGATLIYSGLAREDVGERFGALTIAQGGNTLSANNGGGDFVTTFLSFPSLTRAAGTTVNFTGSNLGQPGSAARIVFDAGLASQPNGILGAWAIANSTDYAAYDPINGVGVVGQGGFGAYDSNFGAGKTTQIAVVQDTVTALPAGGATAAVLKLAGRASNRITFAAPGDVLNLQYGGLLRSNDAFDGIIGNLTNRGVLTAGGNEASGVRELVIFNQAKGLPNGGTTSTVTNGSPIITGINTFGFRPGMVIGGTASFVAGTTVVSVDSDTQLTVSTNATASNSGDRRIDIGSYNAGGTTSGSTAVTMNTTAGVGPGMTISGTGIPVGAFIVSVDSATQVTISRPAVSTQSAQTWTVGVSELVVNAVIADNGAGNSVGLTKSGNGTLTLTAANTYTGGTIVNQGQVNVTATANGTIVIPAGGVTVNGGSSGAFAYLNVLSQGAIDATNDVTINGSGRLTFPTLTTNTLRSLTFNNNGGEFGGNNLSFVGIGANSFLQLTSLAPVTATSSNARITSAINEGSLILATGNNVFDIAGIRLPGQTDVYAELTPTLSVGANIIGLGVAVSKVGNGLLQLGGQNAFTGGLTVSAGGIVLASSSTPQQGGNGLASGPLGAGAVSFAAGTSLFVDNNDRAIGNDLTFAGLPTFNNTGTTRRTLTLNGSLAIGQSGGVAPVRIDSPYLVVAMLGQIPNIGSITSFQVQGLGQLIFNSSGYTGDFNATALGNSAAVSILNDGNGSAQAQTIALPGAVIFDAGIIPNITVGRAGGTLPLNQALNKTISTGAISNLGSGLSLTNNNGYGLLVNQALTVSANAVYSVSGASLHNVAQGLTLAGKVSGAGLTKTGNGTLVLADATNDFVGNVNVQRGVLSISADGQLGDVANKVVLTPASGATATLRFTDDLTFGRSIVFGNASDTRQLEVSAGKTVTLTSAFDRTGGAAATLTKQAAGTLVLGADNTGWTGQFNVNMGVVQVSAANQLTSGKVNIGGMTSALDLSGGITLANVVDLSATGDWANMTGIDSLGAIRSTAGVNVLTGQLNLVNPRGSNDNVNRYYGVGADLNATLTIGNVRTDMTTGGNRNAFLYLLGKGTINLVGNVDNTNGTPSDRFYVYQIDDNVVNVSAANAFPDNHYRIYRGTTNLIGAGTLGNSVRAAVVYQDGKLVLDNTTTNTAHRLGSANRALDMRGGVLEVIPNAAGTSNVTTAALNVYAGGSTINLLAGGNNELKFGSMGTAGGGTLNLIGTFGTSTNKLTFGTTPGQSNGLITRLTVNGDSFAAYNATNGVVAFTGYSSAQNILSASGTATYQATYNKANSLTGAQTISALALTSDAAGAVTLGGLGGLNPSTLTISSGAVLVNTNVANAGTGATLAVPVVAFGGSEAIFHVASGQTLTINSAMTGTNGLTKALPGSVFLEAPQFVGGNVTVNAGTLRLKSGATNTLWYGIGGLGVNNGGTLDLNGGVQYAGNLYANDIGGQSNARGGAIVNTAGTQATLAFNGQSSYNGTIAGDIAVIKVGSGGTTTLNFAEAYTGPTFVIGNLNVADLGSVLGTSSFDVSRGRLASVNDTGSLYYVADRFSDSAPITLRGSEILVNGRPSVDVTERFGAVTLVEGINNINTNNGGWGVASTNILLGGLTRQAGSAATLRFNNLAAYGQPNGVSVLVDGGVALTNNLIGPWAVVDRDWATYGANGVAGLGQPGVAGYSGSGLLSGAAATDNVRVQLGGTSLTTFIQDVVVNTLNLQNGNNGATNTFDLAGFNLRVAGGGLMVSPNNGNSLVEFRNGTITAGAVGAPADLYFFHNHFGTDNRSVLVNAAIVDNGVNGAVRLILTAGDKQGGTSVVTLNGANTYTGGTVINGGARVLGATGVLGTGGLELVEGSLTQTLGGVIPAQALTLGGGSTLTLANQANSFTSLTVRNVGGGVTLNLTGTTTLTGGLTVVSRDPSTLPSVANGILNLGGQASAAFDVGGHESNGVNFAPLQPSLNIVSVVENGGIVKSGSGVLQLSGASTFAGGVSVTAGGLAIGGNSNPLSGTVTSGPLGTGVLTMAANTRLITTGTWTVANNATFLGDTLFATTSTAAQTLTLAGVSTLPSVWNVNVLNPLLTVAISDASPSGAGDVINKSGLGLLNIGNYAGTVVVTGGVGISADGNGRGTYQELALGGPLVLTGDTAITVNRSGSAPFARNKILQKDDLTVPGNIMSVTNLSGYGLEFTGTTTLTGPAHFSVGTASTFIQNSGLILSGVVDDGLNDYGLIKSGPGTLELRGVNTFGGAGRTIDILGGVLAANSDAALGAAGNSVTLNADGLLSVGFRATGSFSTAREFILGQTNNSFEVALGRTLTLTTPFTRLAGNGVALGKSNAGVLELAADNSGWTGPITVQTGVLRLSHNNAAGSGAITASPNNWRGTGVELANNVTITNAISLQGGDNVLYGGVDFSGQLSSFSGDNTYAGPITFAFDASIGARAGSTLRVTGGITNITATRAIGINTDLGGTVIIDGTAFAVGSGSTEMYSVRKHGDGTLRIRNANAVPLRADQWFHLKGGLTTFEEAGTWSSRIYVDKDSSLWLDDRSITVSGVGHTSANGRLGTNSTNAKEIGFRGGELFLRGSLTVSDSLTENLGKPTFARGASTISLEMNAAGRMNLVFWAAPDNIAPAQNTTTGGVDTRGASVLFRGDNFGISNDPGNSNVVFAGGSTFNGQTGGSGAQNKGIFPWALVDTSLTGLGTSFATVSQTAGGGTAGSGDRIVRTLQPSEYSATVSANNNVLLPAGNRTVTGNVTPNSLTFEGASNLALGDGVKLNLHSGGILVRNAGTTVISGGVLDQTNGFSPLNIWTVGSAVLTIDSAINGGNGTTNGRMSMIKAGAGTLVLNPPTSPIAGLTTIGTNSLSGQFVLNEGTVRLGAGLTNAIQSNNFAALIGGTLDLNGGSQFFYSVFADQDYAATNTIVTNTALTTGHFLINNDASDRNWSGSIQGDVKFTRSGNNTTTLYSAHTYTGSTVINGGNVTLRDEARLAGTSSIEVNYGGLIVENTGTISLTDRVNDAAAITLRGGAITLNGRQQAASAETLGVVTLAASTSTLTVTGSGTAGSSSQLDLTRLNRAVGGGTVNFAGANGIIGTSTRVVVRNLNGVDLTVAGSPNAGLTGGILGGWAIVGTSDFATSIPGLGVAALGSDGFPTYSNLTSATNTIALAAATDNVNINAAVTGAITVGADTTLNSLRMGNVASNTVDIAAGKTLTLTSGGLLLFSTATQTIGAVNNQGTLTSGGAELFVYTQGTGPQRIRSVIADGAQSVALVKFGGNNLHLAGTNTYTGGTFVHQGTLNLETTSLIPAATDPLKGLVVSGATVNLYAAGQIATANYATISGSGSLNYMGNNTQYGLVLDNVGSSGNPTIRTFNTLYADGTGSKGVLTVGAGGITATSSNVGTISIIEGRVSFGAAGGTINVGAIDVNGVADVDPLRATLQLQSIVNTTGAINKSGAGVLQLNAQAIFTGDFNVLAGGIRNAVGNAGSRFSDLTISAGARYDLGGQTTTWGSLSGSGDIFSASGTPTLNVGFNNSDSTFSGRLMRFNDAAYAQLTKVGNGTLTMDSAQTADGSWSTIRVEGGRLVYSGAGQAFPATVASAASTFSVEDGSVLELSNLTSALNHRLGLNVAGTLEQRGGTFILGGSASAAVTERITTVAQQFGSGRIELRPNAAQPLLLEIGTLNGGNNHSTLVLAGLSGATTGNGVANVRIGTINYLANGGAQGTGTNGLTNMPVRGDILADASASGKGTGFLTRDVVAVTGLTLPNNGATDLVVTLPSSAGITLGANVSGLGINGAWTVGAINGNDVTLTGGTTIAPGTGLTVNFGNFWRALAADELNTTPRGVDGDGVGGWALGQNAGVSSAQTLSVDTVVNSLTFSGTASLNSGLGAAFGSYGPGGRPLTLQLLGATAFLVKDGVTDIGVGSISSVGGTTIFGHVLLGATANFNAGSGFGLNSTGGFVKAGDGVLNLNAQTYFGPSTFAVNLGRVNLSSTVANTLPVVGTTGAVLASTLRVEGLNAVVDLRNQPQAINELRSSNEKPGQAGTVTNSGGSLVNLTTIGNSVFAGAITGNVNLVRDGNTTTILTGASSYAGLTTVRGGVLQLRDAGALTGTSAIQVHNGSLRLDNFGLNAVENPTRLNPATPITLVGGELRVDGSGSSDIAVRVNSLTAGAGRNTLNVLPYVNMGGTVRLDVGNLALTAGARQIVNINGWSTNNSSGYNTLGNQALTGSAGVFIEQVNGATGPANVNLTTVGTTNASRVVTVPSTAGLSAGLAVTGTNIPGGTTISSVVSATQILISVNATGTSAVGTLRATNLVNNLIGGWAVANGATFATYDSRYGVVEMGYSAGGFTAPGFDAGAFSDATVATGNYNDGTSRTLTGAKVANSWRMAPGAAQDLTFSAGATLTLGVGMVTNGNQLIRLLATDATNTVTTTGGDLYVFLNQNATEIEPKLTGAMGLISSGGATLRLKPKFASNDYTGGTFVNAGTLTLDGTAGLIAIPGDVTVHNAILNMSANVAKAGQVAATSNVTIKGHGRYLLPDYTDLVAGTNVVNRLASVTFVTDGAQGSNPDFGLGNPNDVAAFSVLALSGTNAITSTSQVMGRVPSVYTGDNDRTRLVFDNVSPVITVNAGAALVGLNMNAPITQGANAAVSAGGFADMTSLTKMGAGTVAMINGESNFTAPFVLAQGGLMLGGSSTADGLGGASKGPIGAGTLVIEGGTTILSDNTARTLHNPVTVNGDFTFGGVVAGANVTLAGAIDLGAAARAVSVASMGVTATFNGTLTTAVTGATALTKTGNGTLKFGNASSLNFAGAGFTVAGGLVQSGKANQLPASTLLTVNAGAGYDLNGAGQELEAFAGNGFITNSSNTPALLTLNNAANVTFGGVLADNRAVSSTSASELAFTKNGAGELTLSGASTYVGPTNILDGKVIVANGGSLGTGAVTITSELEYARTDTFSLANEFSSAGSGSLSFVGVGGVAKIVGNSTTGALNVTIGDGSTLQIGDNGTVGALDLLGNLTMGVGSVLRFSRSDTAMLAFSAQFAATDVTSRIEQNGTGKTEISGGQNFVGDVEVNAGELVAAGSSAFEMARLITINAGTLTLTEGSLGYGTGGVAPDVTINGGLMRLLDAGIASNNGVNDLVLAGGTISSGTATGLNSLLVTGAITVTDNATISAVDVGLNFGGTFTAAPVDITVAATKTLTFSGSIANDASNTADSSFDKKGAGTMILSGDNSGMTGSNNVTAGVLDVRSVNALGDGSALFQVTTVAGGMLVSNQSNFGTAGAVAGNITVSTGGSIGVAAPGAAVIGNLAVTSLTMQSGSRIDFKIWDGAQVAGTGYDKLDLGALDLSGVTSTNRITIKLISMSAANAFGDSTLVLPSSPLNFASFDLGTYDVLGSNLGSGNVSDLFTFDTSQFTYAGGTASDAGLWTVDFNAGAITLTAVPEPSTYGFGLGALALAAAALRRRRQTKKA